MIKVDDKTGRETVKNLPAGTGGVKRVLNRVLNLQIGLQTEIFNLFTDLFEAQVESARIRGELDTGAEEIVASELRVKEVRTLVTHQTGSITRVVVEASEVNRPWSVEQLETRMKRGGSGFAIRNVAGRGLDVDQLGPEDLAFFTKTGKATNPYTGAIEDRFLVVFPNKTPNALSDKMTETQLEAHFDNPVKQLRSDLQEATNSAEKIAAAVAAGSASSDPLVQRNVKEAQDRQAEAKERLASLPGKLKQRWGDLVADAPSGSTSEINLIAGAVLPKWREIVWEEAGRLDIKIARPSDGGQAVIGLMVDGVDAARIEQRLSGKTDLSAEAISASVLGGTIVDLDGFIKLRAGRVGRDKVIIVEASRVEPSELVRKHALLSEKVGFADRVWVPIGPRHLPALRSLIEDHAPVMKDAIARLAGSDSAAVSLEAATLGLGRFFDEDVRPTAHNAAVTLISAGDDILRTFAPTSRHETGRRAGEVLREALARTQLKTDRASFALRQARHLFDRQTKKENFAFIAAMDEGKAQANEDLTSIASELRKLLDGRRRDVQNLGTGKLQEFIENYFPRIWKIQRFRGTDAEQRQLIFSKLFGRRPLEGGKSFLKRRTIPTFADGLEAGLEPITDNPVDLVLMRIREMDRYVMGVEVLRDFKRRGIAEFVPVEGSGRVGWTKIDDPIGTVFGDPAVSVTETFDKSVMQHLNSIARSNGFTVERVGKIRGKAAGLAFKGNGRIKTQFATPWDVLAHEIGHQLDWKFGLQNRFIRGPQVGESADERARRIRINKQMRAIADLRFEGSEPGPTFRREVRKRDEKLAAMIQAFVYAPEKFKRVAPDVWAEWQAVMKEHPALRELKRVKPSLVLGTNTHEFRLPGLLIKGHWWTPEPAAVVLNNHLMPGLRSKSGVFRSALGLNNVMNMAQLGWSAFHFTNTMIDSVSSRLGVGIWRIAHGQPFQGLKDIATAPVGGLIHQYLGHKLLREWYQPGGQGAEFAAMMDNVTLAGGRARMDDALRTDMRRQFTRALRRGNIAGAILRIPGAVLETVAWPIMEFIVPRQKMGVFMDLAQARLSTLGANPHRDLVRREMQTLWDVIDDRLGEVVYDNLFWNRYAKDMMQVSTRSVGWNHGTLRVIFGGAFDLLSVGGQTVRAGAQLVSGRPVVTPEMTARAAYLLALPMTTAMIGAIIGKLMTGEWPETMEDYFFPKTGGLDDSGRPRRFSLPTYLKDIFHIAHDAPGTIANKMGPLLDMTLDMLANKDFFGTEIRSKDEPLVVQVQQAAEHFLNQGFTPFGVREFQRARDRGQGLSSQLLPFVGLVPAARAITASAAEQLLVTRLRARLPAGSRTKLQSERAQLRNKLKGRLGSQLRGIPRTGATAGEIIREGFQRGLFTPGDIGIATKGALKGSLHALADRAPLIDIMDAIGVADPDERAILLPLLLKKLGTLRNKPRAEQAKLIPRLRKLIAPAPAAP